MMPGLQRQWRQAYPSLRCMSLCGSTWNGADHGADFSWPSPDQHAEVFPAAVKQTLTAASTSPEKTVGVFQKPFVEICSIQIFEIRSETDIQNADHRRMVFSAIAFMVLDAASANMCALERQPAPNRIQRILSQMLSERSTATDLAAKMRGNPLRKILS